MPLHRRLSIIIPVFNEYSTVALLLEKVLSLPLGDIEKEIIAIESNSTDGTRAVIQRYESEGKLKAIYQEAPQGKGHAVKAGLAISTGEWILIQDADLEYEPTDYPALLHPLSQGHISFVLGSRHLGHRDWRYRRKGSARWIGYVIDCGSWAFTLLFNRLHHTTLTDPATMFKVFARECLHGIHLESNGFELDFEIVSKFIRRGFVPVEVPVTYCSRSFAEGKKVRIWRDGWRGLWAILWFRVAAL